MLVVGALILSILFLITCSKSLKKYPMIFYICGSLLTCVFVFLNMAHISGIPLFFSKWMIPIFSKGIFPAILWYIVAGMNAFPNGSVIIKKWMPIRGELSIFTAIMTMSHAIIYGVTYVRRFVTGNTKTDFIVSFIICLLLMLIMIPLTILSFKKIRKKMNAKKWKKIQKSAYVFYVLIYLHILVIYMQKRIELSDILNLTLYSAIFFGYVYFRLRKYCIIQKKIEKKKQFNRIGVLPIFLTILISVLFANSNHSELQNLTKAENVTIKPTESDMMESESVVEIETETIIESTEAEKMDMSSESIETETQTDSQIESESELITDTNDITLSDETDQTQETEVETEPNIIETNQEPLQTTQETTIEIETETEPIFVYRNGSYTATAYGYDGDITVTITIENDKILNIDASTQESDDWYFNSAYRTVKEQILSSQNPFVDAVSGATYSSNAIMTAVQKALNSAKN